MSNGVLKFFGSSVPSRRRPGVVSKRFITELPFSSICSMRALILECRLTTPACSAWSTSSIEAKVMPSPGWPSRAIER